MTNTPIEITEESGVTGLIVGLMEANRRSMEWTMNQLYDYEREHRLALEVWINDFQMALDVAHGRTWREMDEVLNRFAYTPMGEEVEQYARRHSDWKEPLSNA